MNKGDFCYTKILDQVGISYLGNVKQSAKMMASYRNGTLTYCLYLAPANMSGYEVCPSSEHCREFCLNGSGRNKSDIFRHGGDIRRSIINNSRIKKTKLFFEDRELFMLLLIHEIDKYQRYAYKNNMAFSVRLNGTSDISPLAFKYKGKNILEIFPEVMFYDYTKVYNRISLLERYDNYDLTFSYDGHNWDNCKKFLEHGGRVAVVMFSEDMPSGFCGYPVVDGNLYDMRYIDPARSVVGLHYHKTANDYQMIDGKRRFVIPNTPFVVLPNDERLTWG